MAASVPAENIGKSTRGKILDNYEKAESGWPCTRKYCPIVPDSLDRRCSGISPNCGVEKIMYIIVDKSLLSAKITKSQRQFMHELPPPSYSSRKLVADVPSDWRNHGGHTSLMEIHHHRAG